MASAVVPDQTEILFECAVCLSYMMDRNPRMLSCHHTFCEDCLHQLHQGNKIHCPTCREVTHIKSNVTELAVNFMLHQFKDNMRLLEENVTMQQETKEKGMSKSVCQICGKKPPIYKCKDCPQLMCQICTKEHNDIFQAHHVCEMCEEHQESIIILCQKCVRPLCMKCAVLDHKEHKPYFVEYGKGVDNLQKEAKSLVSRLNEGVSKIDRYLRHSASVYEMTASMEKELKDRKAILAEQQRDVEKMLNDVDKNIGEYKRIKEACLETQNLCLVGVASLKTFTMETTGSCFRYVQLKAKAEETLTNVTKLTQVQYNPTAYSLLSKTTPDPGRMYAIKPNGVLTKKKVLLDITKSDEIKCHQEMAFIGNDVVAATHDSPQHVIRLNRNGRVVARYYPTLMHSEIEGLSVHENRIYISQSEAVTVIPNKVDEEVVVYKPDVDNISNVLAVDKSTLYISNWMRSGKVYRYNPETNKTEVVLHGLNSPTYINVAYTEEGPKYILSEMGANRVNVYNSQWRMLHSFNLGGNRELQPQATSITEQGMLIADSRNNRISHCTLDGQLLGHVVTGVNFPEGIAYKYPHLWVCSLGNYIKCYEVQYK